MHSLRQSHRFAAIQTCSMRSGRDGKSAWGIFWGVDAIFDDNNEVCEDCQFYNITPYAIRTKWEPHYGLTTQGMAFDSFPEAVHAYLEKLKGKSCSNRDDWKTLCLVQQQQHHHQQQYLQKRQWVVGDVWCGSCQVLWKPTCGTISGRRNHFWFWILIYFFVHACICLFVFIYSFIYSLIYLLIIYLYIHLFINLFVYFIPLRFFFGGDVLFVPIL